MVWKVVLADMETECLNGGWTVAVRGRRPGRSTDTRTRTERVSGMTYTRGITTLAATLLMVALAGCSDDPASTTTPSESPSSPSPSTSTTADPPSDSEVAERVASQVLRDYYATVDRLRQDATQPLSQLKTVANGGQLAAQTIFTRKQREAGNRQTGGAQVIELVVQSVNLDSSGNGQVPTVQIDACWDVSAVDVLDRDGQSIVTPARPERGWTRYTLANHEWKTSPQNGWRVVSGSDLEKTPCSAA